MKTKLYRVNESEAFNLMSMYEHLKVLQDEMFYDSSKYDKKFIEEIDDRVEECSRLLEKAQFVGSLVDWPTLKRVREIRDERQLIRYATCLNAGMSERDAAGAFDD